MKCVLTSLELAIGTCVLLSACAADDATLQGGQQAVVTKTVVVPEDCAGNKLEGTVPTQINQDKSSESFYIDDVYIFDHRFSTPGYLSNGDTDPMIGVDLHARNLNGQVITEGLNVHFVAVYCDSQARAATLSDNTSYPGRHIATFDTNTSPVATPAYWELTATWNSEEVRFFIPPIQDFALQYEVDPTTSMVNVSWDARDPWVSSVLIQAQNLDTSRRQSYANRTDDGLFELDWNGSSEFEVAVHKQATKTVSSKLAYTHFQLTSTRNIKIEAN
ncbi:MAG: hypothetical protein IPJ88_04010 [Myxococcales bacterium]|nr:MAG: hypothetical protein IPJ88_04010 [Myxococcales bacterium]